MRKTARLMSATAFGGGYPSTEVWYWTPDETDNPGVGTETPGSENYIWTPSDGWHADDNSPAGTAFVFATPVIRIWYTGGALKFEMTGYPVPVGWAIMVKEFYSLTDLGLTSGFRRWEMSTLTLNGWARIYLDGQSYAVEESGVNPVLWIKDPELTSAYMHSGSPQAIQGNLTVLAAALAAANPDLWSTDAMSVSWYLNNLP